MWGELAELNRPSGPCDLIRKVTAPHGGLTSALW
jgi:hypothetical protein